MKLDFMSLGGGGTSLPRRWIDRRMRRLEVAPLDDARQPIRTGLIAAAIFIGIFFVFALLAPISGAAIAEGEVTVTGSRMVIQPESTAIVSEVLVREGQLVRAGQPLVRLNGIRSGARLRQAQARRDALRATEARLLAERDGAEVLLFPQDLASRSGDPTAAAAMRAQQAIFARRRPILEADRTITDARLAAARARRQASETQLRLIEEELADVRFLYRRGFARKPTMLALERAVAQLRADVAGGGAATIEAEMNQSRTGNGQVVEVVQELARVQEQLAQADPELDVTRYSADRDVLRSPVAGRVSGIARVGPGTVVSGGHTLMEVVPTGRALIVEARIQPRDIDDVHVGAEANVHFSSVNPHGRSSFKGHVVTLSPTRVTDGAGGQPYFRAQIALDDAAGAAGDGVPLQPGLPASVHITTERRTLFSYIFSPFGDAVSRSFREE
ncbi:MAG TPA: HlyD family type I secretion periplasmic adaptor subunit [Allosphingosinicella sp.]|nr:HlyD family type I secretion periplasmic adaptor subunit [Allosphingosinicella sp.]